jgi:hypothetical protein
MNIEEEIVLLKVPKLNAQSLYETDPYIQLRMR